MMISFNVFNGNPSYFRSFPSSKLKKEISQNDIKYEVIKYFSHVSTTYFFCHFLKYVVIPLFVLTVFTFEIIKFFIEPLINQAITIFASLDGNWVLLNQKEQRWRGMTTVSNI